MEFGSVDLRNAIQLIAFAVLAMAAWRWGGGPERFLAAVLVWFKVGDAVNHAIFGPWSNYATVDTGHLFIDFAGLAVAVAVAIFANRFYPLWFAAFQLVATTAHLARELVQAIAPIAYVAMYVGPSYFQIIILAIGIWLHRRRVLRYGPSPSWRTSLRPSPGIARPRSPSG